MAEDKGLTVKDVMNGVLLHADVDRNLVYIARLLMDNNANAVLVRQGGVPAGIVTSKDILNGLIKSSKEPNSILAHEFMTKQIISVNHDEDILTAKSVMVNTGIKKLCVRQGIDVIGLLVQDDILKDLSWYDDMRG